MSPSRALLALADRPVRRQTVKLHPELREATFVSRPNRFVALVTCDGKETPVHVANSGRIAELLHPDNLMLIAPASGQHRKTVFDLALVRIGDVFVSADARLPNSLVQEAIERGRLREFAGYDTLTREVVFNESRLDILLTGPGGQCYLEVKSITLVEDGVALFPDAPTERGSKHLRSLIAAHKSGDHAAVEVYAYRCSVSSRAIEIEDSIPVDL